LCPTPETCIPIPISPMVAPRLVSRADETNRQPS
jgi:hypothetical protein